MNTKRELDPSRRHSLLTGGRMMAGLIATNTAGAALAAAQEQSSSQTGARLPVKEMEQLLRTEGTVANGVLDIKQFRNDLNFVTGPGGIPFKPAFGVYHEFQFQPLREGRAIMNGEMALLPREANAVIDRILSNGLVFQSFHQHFFDLAPQLFHVHLRAIGHPLALARAVANVVAATGAPLPQAVPAHPATPLDIHQLEKILGGKAEVEEDGVVIVSVSRKESIVLDGVHIKPELGVQHTINFEPLDDGRTAVAPDFALIAAEINPLMAVTRQHGFTVHCLYNQETAELPQLYFSHQLAVGDAYALARAIRMALEKTNTEFQH